MPSNYTFIWCHLMSFFWYFYWHLVSVWWSDEFFIESLSISFQDAISPSVLNDPIRNVSIPIIYISFLDGRLLFKKFQYFTGAYVVVTSTSGTGNGTFNGAVGSFQSSTPSSDVANVLLGFIPAVSYVCIVLSVILIIIARVGLTSSPYFARPERTLHIMWSGSQKRHKSIKSKQLLNVENNSHPVSSPKCGSETSQARNAYVHVPNPSEGHNGIDVNNRIGIWWMRWKVTSNLTHYGVFSSSPVLGGWRQPRISIRNA